MALTEIIKELLENGVHFGHLSKHWNPKMKKFIFGKKKNIYIIDLEKTTQKLEEAKEFIRKVAAQDEKVLFVATKKQLRDLTKEQAVSCGMPYVVERWVGGLLTNFSTIRERVKRYAMLLEKREKGEFDRMPRKEVTRLKRELERMDKIYSGIISLDELPGCIYVVDPKREIACVREATRLSIPIVSLIDTDADPDAIDYPIPGNDDAIKSVRCITSCLIEVIKDEAKKAADIVKRKEEEAARETKAKEDEPDVEKYEVLDEQIVKDKEIKAAPRKYTPRKEG
ncbi:MAG: 30S ribosomal protein S2 [Candidatus Omnitrophota bacterium]|nr:30S ribosomal protein S2 [Candidatus Omnitrophota bacterium]